MAVAPAQTVSSLSGLSVNSQTSLPTEGKRKRVAVTPKVYTPIKKWQTRVIRLNAALLDDEPLVADLLVGNLVTFDGLVLHDEQELVSYEAISYTWGPPTFTCPIVCNGILSYITPTLHGALKAFRRKDDHLYLWADALCIDQSDSEEKSVQVRNLFSIYRRADQVLVWLGERGKVDDLVLRCIEGGSEALRSLISTVSSETTTVTAKVVKGLEDLTTRPWSRRVWVQQEVFAAQKVVVHCGPYALSWEAMRSLPTLMHKVRAMHIDTSNSTASQTTEYTERLEQMRVVAGRRVMRDLEHQRDLDHDALREEYRESNKLHSEPDDDLTGICRCTGGPRSPWVNAWVPMNLECVLVANRGLEASDARD